MQTKHYTAENIFTHGIEVSKQRKMSKSMRVNTLF